MEVAELVSTVVYSVSALIHILTSSTTHNDAQSADVAFSMEQPASPLKSSRSGTLKSGRS